MKKRILFLVSLVIALNSCVKHTEITYESLRDTMWMAYEIDNKELSESEQFMFYFTTSEYLKILFKNPENNDYEPKYSFYYSEVKDDALIIDGYYLSSYEYRDAVLYYKKLDSSNKKMEFRLKLSPDSEYINIRMKRLEKVTN